jgi:M6 family metalloprotease-like protein
LKDVFQGGIRIGFDRNPQRVKPLGDATNLIIVVDFPDFQYSGNPNTLVNNVLGPEIVSNFYKNNSYGKLNLIFEVFSQVVRAPKPSSSYLPDASGSFYVNSGWQDQFLTRDILSSVQQSVDLMKYQSVSIFVSGGAGMGGYYGAAVPGNQISTPTGIVRNTSVMGVGIGTINSPVPSWKVFAHEMGHLLGFIDLYIPGVENSRKSPGPFDLMGNTSGTANDFFAWHRWLQGWLDDDSVICDLDINRSKEVVLSPINSTNGKRLYVAPLSTSKLLAIEYRRDSEFDRLNGEDGLLVYVIDLEVKSLNGTVSVQQSEGDAPINFKTDVDLYAKATVTPNQVLYFDNMVIRNTSQNSQSLSFVFENKVDYLKALEEAKTKAAADAKAAALKKTSITCTKGKLSKKLTAVNPKCPTGYKKR